MTPNARADLSIEHRSGGVHVRLGGAPGHPLDAQAFWQLTDVVSSASDGTFRWIVIAGRDGVFSTGRRNEVADIGDRADVRARRDVVDAVGGFVDAVSRSPLMVIAQVPGDAMGLGCALVAICDMSLAASTARFALPELELGLAPFLALAATASVAPAHRMLAVLCRNTMLTADQAYAAGLVSDVVGEDQLEAAVEDLTDRLGRQRGRTVSDLKRFARGPRPDLGHLSEGLLARFLLDLELDRPNEPTQTQRST